MVKININLSNRWLYTILAVIIVILAGVAVWGYTDAGGAAIRVVRRVCCINKCLNKGQVLNLEK